MLSIKDLTIFASNKKILDNLSLEIESGQIHVLMGPNGSGKSTLSQVIAGNNQFQICAGEIKFYSRNILGLDPSEIANLGVFTSFQNPVEIPGVATILLLKKVLQKRLKLKGEKFIPKDFLSKIKKIESSLELEPKFSEKEINTGISGGQKKKNEILQMLILEPKFVILDEIDSGLDVDSQRIVFNSISNFLNLQRSFLIITHNAGILDIIQPNKVHIMKDGKIIQQGEVELIEKIKRNGFDDL